MNKKIEEQFAKLRNEPGKEVTTVEQTKDTLVIKTLAVTETESERELRQQKIQEKREAQLILKGKNDIKLFALKLKKVSSVCGIALIAFLAVAIATGNWKNCSGKDYQEGLWSRCTGGKCVKNYGPPVQSALQPTVIKDPACQNRAAHEMKYSANKNCTIGSICLNGKYKEVVCANGQFFDVSKDKCSTTRPFGCEDVRCENKNESLLYKGSGCRDYFYCKGGVHWAASCNTGEYFNQNTSKCETGTHLPAECSNRCTGKADGTYNVNKVCRTYYKCQAGAYSEFDCPFNQWFNETTGACSSQRPSTCLENFEFDCPDHIMKVGDEMEHLKYDRTFSDGSSTPFARPHKDYFSSCLWYKSPPDVHCDVVEPAWGRPDKQWAKNKCLNGMALLTLQTPAIYYNNSKVSETYDYVHFTIGVKGKHPFVLYNKPWKGYMPWLFDYAFSHEQLESEAVAGSEHLRYCNEKSGSNGQQSVCDPYGCRCGYWFSGATVTHALWSHHWDNQAETNQWNHLCTTIEQTKTGKFARLWLNGNMTERFVPDAVEKQYWDKWDGNDQHFGVKLEHAADQVRLTKNHSQIYIGYAPWMPGFIQDRAGQGSLKGNIKDVYMWDRTLTDAEVQNIYSKGDVPTNKMVLDWEEYRGKTKTDYKQEPAGSILPSDADKQYQRSQNCRTTAHVKEYGGKPNVIPVDNCETYERCSFYTSEIVTCPAGTKINEDTGSCEQETPKWCHNSVCLSYKTSSVTRDCTNYFNCTVNAKQKFATEYKQCDQNSLKKYFNNVTQNCQQRIPDNCPVDGGYSAWEQWGECDSTSGIGRASRKRTCTSPVPKNGGWDCTRLGPAEESANCGPKEAWVGTASVMVMVAVGMGFLAILAGGASLKLEGMPYIIIPMVLFFLAGVFGIVSPVMFKGATFTDCSLGMGYSAIMSFLGALLGFACCAIFVVVLLKMKKHDAIVVPTCATDVNIPDEDDDVL